MNPSKSYLNDWEGFALKGLKEIVKKHKPKTIWYIMTPRGWKRDD